MRWLLLPVLILFSLKGASQGYFQQRVDTHIEVRLDDTKHFLHGFETIHYTNHSTDTLSYIYLHLWPNAYSSERTTFAKQQTLNSSTAFHYNKPSERGFIDSLDIWVDGHSVTPNTAEGLPDIARIDLPHPLLPGGSMQLQTPFRVKIPIVFSRLGHSGQAYYISQWFPKPAVYDRKGWHPLPYSDQGEFFGEIGSYDVQITLPENYIVMATGNCMNEHEAAWLDSLSAVPYPVMKLPTRRVKQWRDSVNRFPLSSDRWKTLHFREDNVHDFAWFADKRFIVRRDTVQVPAGGGIDAHSVTIYAAALPSGYSHWAKATGYIKKTVAYLSDAVGPYPYKTVKAVEGDLKAGGGMEYPTVAVIDRRASSSFIQQTIVHEVGHNWFYGLLATNERDYAWMDEGFNTFYERRITQSIEPSMGMKEAFSTRMEDVLYYDAAATRSDQELNNTSSAFTKGAYGLDVYYKAALMLGWLEGYIGRDTFRTAMKDFYAQWHYRHPYPQDLAEVLQQHTSKPIDWFFTSALQTDKGIDFALKKVRTDAEGTRIRVKNNSGFALPVRVNAYKNADRVDSVWSLPFAKDTTLVLRDTIATVWRIGDEVPDYYGLNNRYRHRGLLHGKTIRVKSGLDLRRQEDAEIYLLPAIGYNVYDGFMVGVLMHNLSVPQNRFRYALAPMFSMRSDEFVGAGSVAYWIYPRRIFREIVPQIDVKTFHYDSSSRHISSVLRARYLKVAPSITFIFKNSSPLSTVTRTLMLKGYAIREEPLGFILDPADSLYKPDIAGMHLSNYGLMHYAHVNDRTFNPFSYTLEAQLGSGFSKLTAEGRLRINYHIKGMALHLRGFTGKFIDMDDGGGIDYSRYWLTSSHTGANDYLYDGTYIGRSERRGFASRQVSIQEGGGKLPAPLYGFPLGRSDDWLAGINIKSDLPFLSLPLRLYLDATTCANADKINPSGSRYLYSSGIELHALRDIFLLHVPLIMSPEYRDYLKNLYPGREFVGSISFSVQFQNVNWLKIISSAMKSYLY